MKTTLIVLALAAIACGDNSENVIVDELAQCSDYCKPQRVKEFTRSDSGYNCACEKPVKD